MGRHGPLTEVGSIKTQELATTVAVNNEYPIT